MDQFLDDKLSKFWEKISEYKNICLIGCAGTFEIFVEPKLLNNNSLGSFEIDIATFHSLYERVKMMSENQRDLIPDLPKERSKYIVVALGLIDNIIKHMDTDFFFVSKYALKEGAIVD